jgi:hypothetical protein
MTETFTIGEMETIEEIQVLSLTIQQLRAQGVNPYALVRLTSLLTKVGEQNKDLMERYAKEQQAPKGE